MRSYVRFLVTGALAVLALGATMLLQGGWQSAAAAFAVLMGAGFLTSLISLRATGDRLASPTPRPARRHLPVVEPRRETAPAPVAAPRPATTAPRPRGRLSSATP